MFSRAAVGFGLLAALVGGRDARAKPAASGYWCYTLALSGSASSACARSEAKCTAAAQASRGLGAGSCAFQATAWSTRIREGGKAQDYLFATKEHCEQQRLGMDGSPCKEVK